MSDKRYDYLMWLHPGGCEIVPPRAAWWQVGKVRRNAPPPEPMPDELYYSDAQRQNETVRYPGVGWSISKQCYFVQLWFEGRRHTVGSYHSLADALAGHDAFVIEHNLPRPLYTRKSA